MKIYLKNIKFMVNMENGTSAIIECREMIPLDDNTISTKRKKLLKHFRKEFEKYTATLAAESITNPVFSNKDYMINRPNQ